MKVTRLADFELGLYRLWRHLLQNYDVVEAARLYSGLVYSQPESKLQTETKRELSSEH